MGFIYWVEICLDTARGQLKLWYSNICANGPAIWGGCVTRRSIRAGSRYPEYSGPESCPGARRVWRTFCRHGTNFIEHYACRAEGPDRSEARVRGTSLIGAGKLSRYRIFIGGTGAVSRYKLTRSRKFITVQDFNCGLMRVSGCMNHYEFVLRAGAKAKSVTSNLPILSVLVAVIFKLIYCSLNIIGITT